MDNDWRLTNQMKYLKGVRLIWRTYTPKSERWDHDHCVFCFAKFMSQDLPGILHEGYCTEDQYYWICQTCFDGFKDKLGWEVSEDPG
jgi:hypothetical protein